MKEIVFENLIKTNMSKEELDQFFNEVPIDKKEVSIYEQQKLDLDSKESKYDLYHKKKYTKVYKDKEDNFKKLELNKNNTIVKYSLETGEVEIAYFEKGFLVPKVDLALEEDIDKMKLKAFEQDNAYWQERSTGRNFKLNKETEEVEFISDRASIEKLVKTVRQGDIRAKKTFYDYALNINWEYFCTFTFKDEAVRNDRNQIKQQWRYFVMQLQKINEEVKVLSVVEEHEKGGYHLHALIADIDLNLRPARNSNVGSKDYRKFLYTMYGHQIFNCTEWEKGFNTIVCINPNSRQQQVINYLTKYITKNPTALFGEKRFYRTRNYEVRNTAVMSCSERQIEKLIKENGMKLIKEDEHNKIKYYQIKVNKAVPKTVAENINKVIKVNTHGVKQVFYAVILNNFLLIFL